MDTADVTGSKNKYDTPDVRICDIKVGEKTQGRPEIIDGASGEQLFKVDTDKEGKKVFPTIVAVNESGVVTVTYKQNGEVKTKILDQYASQELKEARKRKQGAVPSKNTKPKSNDSKNADAR